MIKPALPPGNPASISHPDRNNNPDQDAQCVRPYWEGPEFHTPELGLGMKADSSTLTGSYCFAACSIADQRRRVVDVETLVGSSLPFTKIDGVLVTPALSN